MSGAPRSKNINSPTKGFITFQRFVFYSCHHFLPVFLQPSISSSVHVHGGQVYTQVHRRQKQKECKLSCCDHVFLFSHLCLNTGRGHLTSLCCFLKLKSLKVKVPAAMFRLASGVTDLSANDMKHLDRKTGQP